MVQGQALVRQEQCRDFPVTWMTGTAAKSAAGRRTEVAKFPDICGRESPRCLIAVIGKANGRKGIGGRDGIVVFPLFCGELDSEE